MRKGLRFHIDLPPKILMIYNMDEHCSNWFGKDTTTRSMGKKMKTKLQG